MGGDTFGSSGAGDVEEDGDGVETDGVGGAVLSGVSSGVATTGPL